MKVVSVIFFRHRGTTEAPVKLCEEYEVSSFGFFQRGSVKEVALFVSRGVVAKSRTGERASVTHQEYVAHVRIYMDDMAVVVLTDKEYPQRVAFDLMDKSRELFLKQHSSAVATAKLDQKLSVPELHELVVKYQDPLEVDKLMKIRQDLDQTKEILIKSLDDLVAREDELQQLVDKSDDLSFHSKAFMKSSKDLNSCCIIL